MKCQEIYEKCYSMLCEQMETGNKNISLVCNDIVMSQDELTAGEKEKMQAELITEYSNL